MIGMGASTVLFIGSYLANLLSGLIIAEVAIKQHNSSGQDVPSSFKEFADENLDIPMAGTLIACVSLFVNACIMSFDLTRAGHIVSDLFGGVDPFAMSVGFGALVASLACTQTAKNLSSFASLAVTALFISFAGLLLPGLANIHDPLAVFMTPGTSSDFMSSVSRAAPIILMTCVYQNIVPSVTKILNYDRTKVVAAMVMGSGIPLCMFLAWCYASIGGGIDTSMGAAGPLLTAFSLSAVSGSSIGTVMSISEELDSVFTEPIAEEKESDRFSVPTVLLSVAAPLTVAYVVGGDSISTVLQLAGGYGTPLLYGAIPVAMAWTQRNKLPRKENLVPGGAITLGGLGVGAMAFLGQELFQDISGAFASVVC
jgi:tyrosine-specific transport protein